MFTWYLCACVCADVEVTDRHNQFYEKFQMRQSIGDILMHCWTLQRHRYRRRNAHSMLTRLQRWSYLPGSCFVCAASHLSVANMLCFAALSCITLCCPSPPASIPVGTSQCSTGMSCGSSAVPVPLANPLQCCCRPIPAWLCDRDVWKAYAALQGGRGSYLRFANMLINDSIYLLDESLKYVKVGHGRHYVRFGFICCGVVMGWDRDGVWRGQVLEKLHSDLGAKQQQQHLRAMTGGRLYK